MFTTKEENLKFRPSIFIFDGLFFSHHYLDIHLYLHKCVLNFYHKFIFLHALLCSLNLVFGEKEYLCYYETIQ